MRANKYSFYHIPSGIFQQITIILLVFGGLVLHYIQRYMFFSYLVTGLVFPTLDFLLGTHAIGS